MIMSKNIEKENLLWNQKQVISPYNKDSINLRNGSSLNRYCIPLINCSSDTDGIVGFILVVTLILCCCCSAQCHECRQINKDIECLTL
jgi:hypothetical protein